MQTHDPLLITEGIMLLPKIMYSISFGIIDHTFHQYLCIKEINTHGDKRHFWIRWDRFWACWFFIKVYNLLFIVYRPITPNLLASLMGTSMHGYGNICIFCFMELYQLTIIHFVNMVTSEDQTPFQDVLFLTHRYFDIQHQPFLDTTCHLSVFEEVYFQ